MSYIGFPWKQTLRFDFWCKFIWELIQGRTKREVRKWDEKKRKGVQGPGLSRFLLWATKVPFPGELQEMVLTRPWEELIKHTDRCQRGLSQRGNYCHGIWRMDGPSPATRGRGRGIPARDVEGVEALKQHDCGRRERTTRDSIKSAWTSQ